MIFDFFFLAFCYNIFQPMRRSKAKTMTKEAVDKIINEAVGNELISLDLNSPSTSCIVYEIQEELATVRQIYIRRLTLLHIFIKF